MISCVGSVDSTRFLLGDANGRLLMLFIESEQVHVHVQCTCTCMYVRVHVLYMYMYMCILRCVCAQFPFFCFHFPPRLFITFLSFVTPFFVFSSFFPFFFCMIFFSTFFLSYFFSTSSCLLKLLLFMHSYRA